MNISKSLDTRFKTMGATKSAMQDALKYVYKDMMLTIESQEETIEYLDKQDRSKAKLINEIGSKWWFKLFAPKHMKKKYYFKN